MFITINNDFEAINTDKISKIWAYSDNDKDSGKTRYFLAIYFDIARLLLEFKDEKSTDNAYLELLTDLKNNTIKSKYDFKNVINFYNEDIELISSYFKLLNNDFIALNDNLLDALSK